jgi:hypothetical protein
LARSSERSGIKEVVEYWEKAAGVYLLHESIGGEEVCRLYHQEFANHLEAKLGEPPVVACAHPACPHSSPAACVAMALLGHVKFDAQPGELSTHLLEHLPGYLEAGKLADPLYDLVYRRLVARRQDEPSSRPRVALR